MPMWTFNQPASRPTLFLHIGMNKTGTSAIQRYCSEHRKWLQTQGVLYPYAGCKGHAHFGLSSALGFDHTTQTPQADVLEKLADQLRSEMARAGTHICIMSSENFVMPRAIDPVRAFFQDFDCRIVLYLRRHDHWWASAYAQAVKMKTRPPWEPGIRSFMRYNDSRHPEKADYLALLKRWADAFGIDHMLVRPYESAQNPGGITADFFQSIGEPIIAEQAAQDNRQVNESLHPTALFIIDLLQRAELPEATRTQLIQMVKDDRWERNTFHLMPPPLRSRLIQSHAAEYSEIAKTFMQRPGGMLFTEPAPDPNEPWERPAPPSHLELVTRFGQYFAKDR